MFFVYILRCNDNTYYKGISIDVQRRFGEHLSGECRATKNKNPEIIFVQVCNNRVEARELEKYFKSGTGREIIMELS